MLQRAKTRPSDPKPGFIDKEAMDDVGDVSSAVIVLGAFRDY